MYNALSERLPSSLPTPFSLRLSGVMLLVQIRGLGASYVKALSQFFWQLQLINLGLSSIALSNYIHPNLAYCLQSTPLHDCHPCNHKNVNCRSNWRDQWRIERGTPIRLGTFGCKKIVLIFTVKNMLKFENF